MFGAHTFELLRPIDEREKVGQRGSGQDNGNHQVRLSAGFLRGALSDVTLERDGITARYFETEAERVLTFEHAGRTAAVTQNRVGYAMVKVRTTPDGDELERYYGFDMALDHAAELVKVAPHDLPIPDEATDMEM